MVNYKQIGGEGMKVDVKELSKTTGLSERQIRRDLRAQGIEYKGQGRTSKRDIFINHNYFESVSSGARYLADQTGKSDSHMRSLINRAKKNKVNNEPSLIIGDWYLT